MHQTKQPRPTFADAHDFQKTGIRMVGSPDHIVSEAERKAIAEEAYIELTRLLKEQFPRSGNLEYAILKAHLIVEFAVTDYIRCTSRVLVPMSDLRRFTFSQKLEIAYLMGLGGSDPFTLPTIERLNKIRNQAAHEFVLDRALVDEMLRVNSGDYDTFEVKDDRDRVRRLRMVCHFICGKISGQIQAQLVMANRSLSAPTKDDAEG